MLVHRLLEFLAVAGLGAGIGMTELSTRYRDSPRRLFAMQSFWLYLFTNAGASVLALLIIHASGWTPGNGSATFTILIAGLGSMVVLRSSIAVVKLGEQEVAAGPAAVVMATLTAIDRVIDRNQARRRSQHVAKVMKGVSFAKAYKILPSHCLRLLQSQPASIAEQLGVEVAKIAEVEADDQVKAYELGIVLMTIAGPVVLEESLTTLYEHVRADKADVAQVEN